MSVKKPVILFFVDGFVATPEQISQGDNMPGATVHYRNAQQIRPDDNLEPADGVFGAVPESYQGYPSAKDAVTDYQNRLDSLKKASGDVEAPKSSGGPKKPFKGDEKDKDK